MTENPTEQNYGQQAPVGMAEKPFWSQSTQDTLHQLTLLSFKCIVTKQILKHDNSVDHISLSFSLKHPSPLYFSSLSHSKAVKLWKQCGTHCSMHVVSLSFTQAREDMHVSTV